MQSPEKNAKRLTVTPAVTRHGNCGMLISISRDFPARRTMTQTKPEHAAPPSRDRNPSDKPHAPGSSTPLHTIPDDQADRVVPRDPRETQAHQPGESSHPGGSPYPPEHDKPDQSGNRPKPL